MRRGVWQDVSQQVSPSILCLPPSPLHPSILCLPPSASLPPFLLPPPSLPSAPSPSLPPSIYLPCADSPVECKDADCDEEREECAELKNDAVSGLVVCLRRNRTRATPTPDGGHPELPRRAQSCQDLDCERGFECLHSRRDGRGQARCRRISKRAGQCFVLESAPIFDRPNVTRPTRRPDATRPVTNRRPDATRPVTNRRPDVTRAVTADVQQPTRRPVRGLELTINLPDRCVERECCGGERCIMRRMFDNRAPLAVCVPVRRLE